MAEIFHTSGESDAAIACGTKRYQVHRTLLMCHSVYFKACFFGNFMEANECECMIDLKEDPPEAVEAMLQYFYKLDYEVQITQDPDEADKYILELHSMIYAIADKYQVPDLKELARVNFATALVQGDGSIYFAVPHIFESTPETDFGLRDMCLLSYGISIPVEKESGRCGNGDVAGLIQSCRNTLIELPDLSAELATFILFSQAGLLSSKDEDVVKTTGSEQLMEEMFRYLGKQKGGGLRAKSLRVLVNQLGTAGW